ncbi:MAG: DUF362 domain-containing protein [Desulfarculus sp.]|nr:DUF362 domain-containing protein [Desulfarculus sp.]MBV1740146.1 DUF362 domain-containing protein [Desulfarculus sp.]
MARTWEGPAEVFIGRANSYEAELGGIIDAGLRELGIGPKQTAGKSILLKPNLVESSPNTVHVCTHPAVVWATAEAFWRMGALKVMVGEGPGHCTDTIRTLDQSGLSAIIDVRKLPFVDLNRDEVFTVANQGGFSTLSHLSFPATLQKVDMVVSLAKMKTHHWAGVTLSMKNLFGIMPGNVYGWPKNVLHHAGLSQSILDISATFPPQLAIVDGIVGMEGDGPIMGTPKQAGIIVIGKNLPAVDATCARIMGINPLRVEHLRLASGAIGTVRESNIEQRGETISSVMTPFELKDYIPAHRNLRKT